MALWLDILRSTLITLREGDERDLSDTWIKRRRSFGSMNDLFSDLSRHTRPALLKELSEAGIHFSNHCRPSLTKGLSEEDGDSEHIALEEAPKL